MLLMLLVLSAVDPASVAGLEQELLRVDRSVEETEALIGRTPTAAYLPELRFRLCELLVRKSRLTYHLQVARRGPDAQGPFASPEVRLLKEKAVAQYARLLREAPGYAGADKVRFYMAHEQRELGLFDEMVKTLVALTKKSPKSPLALEAELILGDHFFDAAQLEEAEPHYLKVLKGPASAAQELARYKLGWVRVNAGDHAGAVEYFAATVGSKVAVDAANQKALDVRRQALLDLVYSYVEVKPAKGALAYFERLSDSTATYALALEKLAARYQVKQQPEFAVAALRKLLSLRADPERDVERVQALYDALRDPASKSTPQASDVAFLVRAAVEVRKGLAGSASDRAQQLVALEEMARDLSTRLHTLAQKRDDRRLLVEAAAAYQEYLSLFRPAAHVVELMRNRADALYAAQRFPEAAKQFEALARRADGSDDALHQESVYGALLAHKAALGEDELRRRTRLEVVDARQALKRLGSAFVRWYPGNAHVASVQFNIARAHFDDGEYRDASRAFTAFALTHPQHPDAPVAGHLALDALGKLKDFPGLEQAGQQLLAAGLPTDFKDEVRRVLADVQGEALTELALASAQKAGDVVAGLEQAAAEAKDEASGARALNAAMLAAREKGDFPKERALAQKLLSRYPNAPEASGVTLALARRAADTARFGEAAALFEKAEAFEPAANLYFALGETDLGAHALEQAALKARGHQRAELYATLAQKLLEEDDAEHAKISARNALAIEAGNVRAAAVLVEVGGRADLARTLRAGEGDAAARGLWHLAEADFQAFAKLPGDALEQKLAAWQALQGSYTQIAQLGSPEWTVASLWRVGLGYQALLEAVEAAAGEGGLESVASEVATLKAGAQEAFSACVQRAEAERVFTDAVVGCRSRSAEGRAAWAEPPRPSGQRVPEALQAKVDRAKDAESLAALGSALLEQGSPGAARLTYARALEADKAYGPAFTGMGFALLQLGEASSAAAAYGQALSADPSNAVARGNLAALRCRFGDVEGARAELEKVSDVAQLSGAVADTGWKRCAETWSRR